MLKWILVVILGLAIFGGLLAALWISAPRLVDIFPAPGSREIPVGAALQITFSHPMQPESVLSHLFILPERRGSFTWQGTTLLFLPEQPWPSGSEIVIRMMAGARAAGGLGLPLLRSTEWSFSTGQTLLAYLWPASDRADLYILDPNSGDIHRLTQTSNVIDYSISQNGAVIYFSARNALGEADLYRLDRVEMAKNPGQTVLPEMVLRCLQASCRTPQVSPEGQFLAYERTPLSTAGTALTQVWLLNLENGDTWAARNPEHTSKMPAWSSSGWLSVYDKDEQAFILSKPGGVETINLPNQTGESGSWKPGGSAYVAPEIVIEAIGFLEPRASSHLLLFNLERRSEANIVPITDLTQQNDLEDTSPVFSPDGKRIAFTRKHLDKTRWTPGRQLWVMQADGSQPAALTNTPFYNHYDLAWSTDSQSLAFVRFEQTALNQPPELWIVNADGSNPVQLVIGGYAPTWIP